MRTLSTWQYIRSRTHHQLSGFEPNDITDITSYNFFDVHYHFVDDVGNITYWTGYDNSTHHTTLSDWARWGIAPNVWPQADNFAKAFYSSIMADLGNANTQNILTNSTLLQRYSLQINNMPALINLPRLSGGPAGASYNELRSTPTMGNLSITPSTFFTEYLCEVPRRKPTGTLFLTVLVADLVLLQAVWTIVTFIAAAINERRNKNANVNVCERCLVSDLEVNSKDSQHTPHHDPTGRDDRSGSSMTCGEEMRTLGDRSSPSLDGSAGFTTGKTGRTYVSCSLAASPFTEQSTPSCREREDGYFPIIVQDGRA